MRCIGFISLAIVAGLHGMEACAGTLKAQKYADSPGMQCHRAIDLAQRAIKVPGQLLAAIGRVETGRWDAQTASWQPWPWSINAQGQGSMFETKAEAIAAVRALQARGVVAIDVGCMQIDLMYHPSAFSSLDEAFDPSANALYAAQFLDRLFAQTNDWSQAAALYHSATPELGAHYRLRVMAVWPDEAKRQAALVEAALAHDHLVAAWAATLPSVPASSGHMSISSWPFAAVTSPRHLAEAKLGVPAAGPKQPKLSLAAD